MKTLSIFMVMALGLVLVMSIVSCGGGGGGGGGVAPPSTPGNVSANADDRSVFINWNAVAGATFYNIYITEGGSGGQAASINVYAVSKVSDIIGSSYTHTCVPDGTTYYYTVTAENGAGESDESAEVSATADGNDSIETANPLIIYSGIDGSINCVDDDDYLISEEDTTTASGTYGSYDLSCTITLTNLTANLDMELYYMDGTLLDSSENSGTNDEVLRWCLSVPIGAGSCTDGEGNPIPRLNLGNSVDYGVYVRVFGPGGTTGDYTINQGCHGGSAG